MRHFHSGPASDMLILQPVLQCSQAKGVICFTHAGIKCVRNMSCWPESPLTIQFFIFTIWILIKVFIWPYIHLLICSLYKYMYIAQLMDIQPWPLKLKYTVIICAPFLCSALEQLKRWFSPERVAISAEELEYLLFPSKSRESAPHHQSSIGYSTEELDEEECSSPEK